MKKEKIRGAAEAGESRPTRHGSGERPASTIVRGAVNQSVLSKDLLRAFFRTPRHTRPDSTAPASLRRHARGRDTSRGDRGSPPIGELSSVLGRDSSLAHSFVRHSSSFDDDYVCTFPATTIGGPPISENSSSDTHPSLILAALRGLEIARIVVHLRTSPGAGAVFRLSARPPINFLQGTSTHGNPICDVRRRVFHRPGPIPG
jgi:hypothetical protein